MRVQATPPQAAPNKDRDFLSSIQNGYWRINSAGIKDDDLRRNLSWINSIVPRVHHLDDGISGFEMQCFPIDRHNRELPAHQHAGIDYWMTVGVEPGSRRYADPQNSDLGLTLRVRRQTLPIPAPGRFNEFLDDWRGIVRLLTAPNRAAAGLQEKNKGQGRKGANSLTCHKVAFFLVRLCISVHIG